MKNGRASGAFRIAVVAAVLAFVAMMLLRSVEPLALDQGLFACFARWVPRGWLPYRDLFDSKPPLFLYTWGLSSLMPGTVVHAAWVLEAVWLAATLWIAYALASRVWDRWVGLASAVLLFVGLWDPRWGAYWSRMQAEELLALPLLGAAWLAWRAHDRARLAFFAGVLTGVAGLYKIPSMAVAGAWAIAWLPSGGWPRRVALLAAGIAAPWALAAGWFAAHGAWHSFVEGVFVYHRYNAEYIAPPWGFVLAQLVRELASGAGLSLLLAAAGLAVLARRRARESSWLATWIALTVAAVVLQRQLAGYHFLLTATGLSLAGGLGLVELLRAVRRASGARRALAGAGLAAATVLALLAGARWIDAYGADARAALGRIDRDRYLAGLVAGPFSPAVEEQAARYLATHSAPGDGLLVWGLSPGIYALADRHPVTRFPFHKILYTDAPLSLLIPGLDERRADLLTRLKADPPAYILVGRGDRNGFEPESSMSSLNRFAELHDFVDGRYHIETELGRFVVFRRN